MTTPRRLLSLSDAVEALGISESAVRRRIRKGSLKAERQKTPQGFAYAISPESMGDYLAALKTESLGAPSEGRQAPPSEAANSSPAASAPEKAQEPTEPPAPTPSSELVALVREQQAEIKELAGQLGFMQAENGQLKEQVKLLESPPVVVEPEPKRRHWYWLWLRAT